MSCNHKFIDSNACVKCGWKQPDLNVRFEFKRGARMGRVSFVNWWIHEGRKSLEKHQFLCGVIEAKIGDPGWKEVHCDYKQTGGSRSVPRHSWSLEFV